ncbi:hypothetical protein [Actinomadura parmotrematis]|uniref:RAMA domain-containing protein n=1 Tax=Actinomadura parmotrematis TaxID=2864039 RepID=A0ABS7FU80_9ACTN|nr:hypothetical protein [Actinomadura parmotrematis]MBW8483952.1 hypothetical protein [Actinomadura parmotrematis]
MGDLSARVTVPETAAHPVEIYIDHAALCVAIVERHGMMSLPGFWDVPGAYILLDSPSAEGDGVRHVGEAPAGIRTRLMSRAGGEVRWSRALLIRRDTSHGFRSDQIGPLGDRLRDLFDTSGSVRLCGKGRTGDENLAPHDRQMLDSCVMPIARVLRLIGHDPAEHAWTPPTSLSMVAAPPPAEVPPPVQKTRHDCTVLDLINAGLLKPYDRLFSTSAKRPGEALVLPDGHIEYGDQVFTSVSGAARELVGTSINGWYAWAVDSPDGRVELATLRSALGAVAEKT